MSTLCADLADGNEIFLFFLCLIISFAFQYLIEVCRFGHIRNMYSSKITTVRLVKMSVSNTILLNSIQLPFFIYSIRVNDNVITYFSSNIECRRSATIFIPPYYNRITIHIIKMTIIAILRNYT